MFGLGYQELLVIGVIALVLGGITLSRRGPGVRILGPTLVLTAQWARTLPIGKHGITAPTLWARLGDTPGRWESFRHLQAQAGVVPVTKRSGKQRVIHFRFAVAAAPGGPLSESG